MSRLGELDAALMRLRRFWSHPEVRRFFAHRLDPSVEPNDYRTLRAIERATGAPSVGEVADELRVDASTASRMVERVVHTGQVRRATSTEDRRRSVLELTERGHTTLQHLNDVRIALLRELTKDWLAEEIATLGRMLTRLDEACNQLRATVANDQDDVRNTTDPTEPDPRDNR